MCYDMIDYDSIIMLEWCSGSGVCVYVCIYIRGHGHGHRCCRKVRKGGAGVCIETIGYIDW